MERTKTYGSTALMDWEELINRIHQLQSPGNETYLKGMFPSQRVHKGVPYCREDNNLFFSALIAFTLQSLIEDLPKALQSRVQAILDAIVVNYRYYEHWKGQGSYNFWMSNPSRHFPNGRVLHRMPSMAIPDDADDSSLVFLTGNFSPAQRAWFKQSLENHYGDGAVSPLTERHYVHFRAYPTFFGKKILREMDACVLCNVLYFVMHFRLPLTATDRDSLGFLSLMLERDDYRNIPFHVSPNYGKCSIILYHLARLAGSFDEVSLIGMRPVIIDAIKREINHSTDFMDTLLLHTSLWRLKVQAPPLDYPEPLEKEFQNFYFFQAGMLTNIHKSLLKKAAAHPFFHLKYRCAAYYWTLILEYEVLKHRHSRS